MKKIFVLMSLLMSISLLGTEYAVVSSSLQKISLAQIKALYLKKTHYIGNTKVVPLNLQPRDKIRSSFEKHILHMSFTRLKSYWTKQHYLGHRPPVTLKSQKSVLAFIKNVDGAVGYVELKDISSEYKILYKWSE